MDNKLVIGLLFLENALMSINVKGLFQGENYGR